MTRFWGGMTPHSITFISETHRHIESVEFIEGLVSEFVRQNKCLTVALEIDDVQQPAMNRVLTEGAAVSNIDIPSMIDHLPMRQMITHMAVWKKNSSCLNVVAIDTGIDTPYDRDQWMAKRLSELAGDTPVLVLLGSLHTIKKVDWLVATGKPSVAEILTNKGFRVKSFPQCWIPDQCKAGENRYSRFVSADSPKAVTILNQSLMSLINAKRHKSAQGVVDGFVIWECGN